MLKVYNSLAKEKQEFRPIDNNLVKMYTCGVTTYDDCHIGHSRSMYIFDVIRSYLEYKGYEVEMVRNITDIDDKIIKRAKLLGVDWRELSKKYIDRYEQDVKNFELNPVELQPKATENIKDMIEYIGNLIDKGYAYLTDTGVYFEVRKFKKYGMLSGQKIDAMRDSVRVQSDENKKDPLDFALWKKSQDDEPGWESPWQRGRPGWHIECSVMSQKYLKRETLDIHGGGRDLIFPHHENECAQTTSLSGSNLAKYWLHHGLLTIEGQKMSKSLGNFVSLGDVLEKYSPDVLKLFYLQAHYSSSIDFSWQKMEQANKAYEHVKILKYKLKNYLMNKDTESRSSFKMNPEILNYRQNFIKAMDDDFNMPKGLAVLFDLISRANSELSGESNSKNEILLSSSEILDQIAKVFGFTFSQKQVFNITESQINELIEKRNQYRRKKQFLEADQIRQQLLSEGVILEDTQDGTIWRKK